MPSEKCWNFSIIIILIIVDIATCARPRFDSSTDMGLVLVPADAEVDSVIFRLRATDQDTDFPLVFEITATVTPVVRIENLPCTLYNKVCSANVILTKRLIAGRFHDFAVRVRDSKGDSNSMQATISVTNATTQRDKIFPHIPALIMVPENAKPGKELDYVLVRSNPWSGKPVYIELWQPKELFTIKQRQTPAQTRGIITLTGELDFETQTMHTLTIYATDPYTEPHKDTRNIAGLHLVVIVQDVQDVPPIFTLAPPLTKINNTIQPGDVILRVHAEDGDKGVPREVTYGLVSEGNPFTIFFNISESTGEVILARPLEELTKITHVGAPIVLSIVAEEIRRSSDEPPAQATVVEVGLLLGEPGNSPPSFDNDNYVAWMDENAEPGTTIIFTEPYSTKVSDEDIGKAGVFALKLGNNNGTFEINPTVAERSVKFILTVRDNSLIDYELHKSLIFKIIAQEVGPATNLSTSVPVTIFLRDVNDNPPEFQERKYEITVSENITAGSRVLQVHATDKDTGLFGRIQYTRVIGAGAEAFLINPVTGVITIAMGTNLLDREMTAQLQLTIEARDEDGKGLRGTVSFIVNLLDVNDNPPVFEKDNYQFILNMDLTNFSTPAFIKAFDADAEPPNNIVRYELIQGNYDNQFFLNEETGELTLRKQITKIRYTRHNNHRKISTDNQKNIVNIDNNNKNITKLLDRKKRDDKNILYTLTARAYDLGVPHLSTTTVINIIVNPLAGSRKVMFVVPGEHPDRSKLANTLETITGGKITVESIEPYVSGSLPNNFPNAPPTTDGVKRSIVIARVEQLTSENSLVDIDKIRAVLEANGVNVIHGDMSNESMEIPIAKNINITVNSNKPITTVQSDEVIVYRAENKVLYWLLMILGLLLLLTIIGLILCCVCPRCPFYMSPRKRRIHSSETIIARSDGRPKRHLHRRPPAVVEGTWEEKKQAWSADARTYWQFNRRNGNNGGIASLPGDVARVHDYRDRNQPQKAMSLRLNNRDNNLQMYEQRYNEQERIYIEDIEMQKPRYYDQRDIDSLRQHEFEKGSYKNRDSFKQLRDQHYYRDGNTEIMRLVTRDGVDETTATMHRHPEIIINDHPSVHRVDGKDILLRRFIEDQKLRGQEFQDVHDVERQSMDSHQRQKKTFIQQQEVLIIPDKLDQHVEEIGPDVQRLIMNHGNYETDRTSVKQKMQQDILTSTSLLIPMAKTSMNRTKEQMGSSKTLNAQSYVGHDFELARQNALLTRILLERDGRIGGLIDSASYLETQSLPGQVAAGTQTDHSAATQTEPIRSRSDNEESEEDARGRRKLKLKKRYNDEVKRTRTSWIRSPIQEEDRQYIEKQKIGFRKKTRDNKDTRKIEPEVLKEISDSLDETGDISASSRQFIDSANSQDNEDIDKYKNENNDNSLQQSIKKEVNKLHKKLKTKLIDNKKVQDIENNENSKLKLENGKINLDDKNLKINEIKNVENLKYENSSNSEEHVKISDEKSKKNHALSISTASSEIEEIMEKLQRKNSSKKDGGKIRMKIGKEIHPKLRRQKKIEMKEKKKKSWSNESGSEKQMSPIKSARLTKNHDDYDESKKLDKPSEKGIKNYIDNASRSTKEILKKLTVNMSSESADKLDDTETSPEKIIQDSSRSTEDSLGYISPEELSRQNSQEAKENEKKIENEAEVDEEPVDKGSTMKSFYSAASFVHTMSTRALKSQESDTKVSGTRESVVQEGEVPVDEKINSAGESSVQNMENLEKQKGEIDNRETLNLDDKESDDLMTIKSMDSAVTVMGSIKEMMKKAQSDESNFVDDAKLIAEEAKDFIEEKRDDVVMKIKNKIEKITEDRKKSLELAKLIAEEAKDSIEGKREDVVMKIKDKIEKITENRKKSLELAKLIAEEAKDSIEEKREDVVMKIKDKIEKITEDRKKSLELAKLIAEEAKDSIEEKREDVVKIKDKIEKITEERKKSLEVEKIDDKNESKIIEKVKSIADDAEDTVKQKSIEVITKIEDKIEKITGEKNELIKELSNEKKTGHFDDLKIEETIETVSDKAKDIVEQKSTEIISEIKDGVEKITGEKNIAITESFEKEEKHGDDLKIIEKVKSIIDETKDSIKKESSQVVSKIEANIKKITEQRKTSLEAEKIVEKNDLKIIEKVKSIVDDTKNTVKQKSTKIIEESIEKITGEKNKSTTVLSKEQEEKKDHPDDLKTTENIKSMVVKNEDPVNQKSTKVISKIGNDVEKISEEKNDHPDDLKIMKNIKLVTDKTKDSIKQESSEIVVKIEDSIEKLTGKKKKSIRELLDKEKEEEKIPKDEEIMISVESLEHRTENQFVSEINKMSIVENTEKQKAAVESVSPVDVLPANSQVLILEEPALKSALENVNIIEKKNDDDTPMNNTSTQVKIDLQEESFLADELMTVEKNSDAPDVLLNVDQVPALNSSSSSSRKNSLIIRETSFLNSPRRQPVEEKNIHGSLESIQSNNLVPELKIQSPSPILDDDKSTVKYENKDVNKFESSDTIEDDSDVSSESSTKTAFTARPYGTPRHRHLIRLDQSIDDDIEDMKNLKTDDLTLENNEEIISVVMTEPDDEKSFEKMESILLVNKIEEPTTSTAENTGEMMKEKIAEEANKSSMKLNEEEMNSEEQNKVEIISKNKKSTLQKHDDDDGSTYVPDESTLMKKITLNSSDESRKSTASSSSTTGSSNKSTDKKTTAFKDNNSKAMKLESTKKIQRSNSQRITTKKNTKSTDKNDDKKIDVPVKSSTGRGVTRIPSISKQSSLIDLKARQKPSKLSEKKNSMEKLISTDDKEKQEGEKKIINSHDNINKPLKKLISIKKKKLPNDQDDKLKIEKKNLTEKIEDKKKNDKIKVDKLPTVKYKIIKLTPQNDNDKVPLKEKHEIICEKKNDLIDLPLKDVKLKKNDSINLKPEDNNIKKRERSKSPNKITKEELTEAQSRYMEWYKQNREEMERKKLEKFDNEIDEQPPKWLRKSTRQRWLKMSPEDRKIFDIHTPEITPKLRRRIKPLINIESEQLRAIIRQGRQLRRAEGDKNNEPVIEIYAPDKPPPPQLPPPQPSTSSTMTSGILPQPKYHYLIQHSEYNFERIPAPFYLHPPSSSNQSPQLSPQQFEESSELLSDNKYDDIDKNCAPGRLRHQQLLEKKSVFDIAYSEASPSHLRADSTTPPS